MKTKVLLTSIWIKYIAIFIIFLAMILVFALKSKAQQRYILTTDTLEIKELVITSSYAASRQTPFTFQNIQSKDILLKSAGNEPAVLLSTTPSITIYSENGTGLGYVYYRLRGIDQTRLNTTLNGVPLNEPEDQGIYFNNSPGFLHGISSVQIIRGAGLSKPGVSSYGGSINFNSLEFSKEFSGFAEIVAGSYRTTQIHAGVNSPYYFINISKMYTDGYKDNDPNDSWSTFYGAKFKFKNEIEFRWYGFIGHQQNGQGWIGETIDSLRVNPRKNTNTEYEKDNFIQVHNQITLRKNNLRTTIFYTYLKGRYGIQRSNIGVFNLLDGIDTINLVSNWFGTNLNYLLSLKATSINIGLSAYTYTRQHYGNGSSPLTDTTYKAIKYDNIGTKFSASPYIKVESKILEKLTIYGDIQYRMSTFSYNGDSIFPDKNYKFLDWSAGLSYKINEKFRVYYGIGKTHKEPKRYDYFGGSEWFMPFKEKKLVPEELLSNELGLKYKDEKIELNANLFYMSFKNELLLSGNIGQNALFLSDINVASSYRRGLETDIIYKPIKSLELHTNVTLSQNKTSLHLVQILTPNIVSNFDATYKFNKCYIGIGSRYNSESYVDFNNEEILPAYIVFNMNAGVVWDNFELKGTINNITNKIILTSAYIGYNSGEVVQRYFNMAKRNFMLTLTYKF